MSKARKSRARKRPAKPQTPFGGDHGTGTLLADRNTVLEPMLNEKGENPNHIARRRRRDALEGITMTMRQEQAARAIRDAYCRCEMLASGGPLKQKVDNSQRPDAAITTQVDANSELVRVMKGVPNKSRGVVEHVCWHNEPIATYQGRLKGREASANFKVAMDLVANRLGY